MEYEWVDENEGYDSEEDKETSTIDTNDGN